MELTNKTKILVNDKYEMTLEEFIKGTIGEALIINNKIVKDIENIGKQE